MFTSKRDIRLSLQIKKEARKEKMRLYNARKDNKIANLNDEVYTLIEKQSELMESINKVTIILVTYQHVTFNYLSQKQSLRFKPYYIPP